MGLCPMHPESTAPAALQQRPRQRQGQVPGSGQGPLHTEGKKNRKDRRRPANSVLVATADHTGKQPQQDPPGHFHELMESPCTNHAYPIKHLYKDCELLKRLL